MIRLLLIDNFDSFTFNLLHLFGELPDVEVTVRRNNEPFLEDISAGKYDAIVISPGPGSPDDKAYFGNCEQTIKRFGPSGIPILGVCLGFQGIALAFGAKLKRAPYPMHGKTTGLRITQPDDLLAEIPDDTPVMRYHSIMIDRDQPFPESLIVTGETTPGELCLEQNGPEIMAFRHATLPIYGVQFHPESFGTECGTDIAKHFVAIAQQRLAAKQG